MLRIKRLLYDEGFTIAGARRHLREAESSALAEARLPAASRPARRPATIGRKVLLDLRDSLRAFLTLLESE